MMREVVGGITGIIVTLYLLYFALPLLETERIASLQFFNQTDPTIATSLTLGSGWYTALPFIGIMVMVFLLIAYALRREPFE